MTRSSRADRSPPGDPRRSLDRAGPALSQAVAVPDPELCRAPATVPDRADPPSAPAPLATTRQDYVAALLQLYREQPDTPAVPRRQDRMVAADLYRQGVPLATVAHAIRLATLRRHIREPGEPPLPPIRSLAYYRRVLQSLTPEELEPGYVAYLAAGYARLLVQLQLGPPPSSGGPP